MDLHSYQELDKYALLSDPQQIREVNPKDLTLDNYMHASHTVLYSLSADIAIKQFPKKANIMMQMRFDGYIGFPGGLVDDGESAADAATREMVEEIAYDPHVYGSITHSDHLFTHVDDSKKLVLHFYSKKVTEEEMLQIVKTSTSAVDYGSESLGVVFVPLYTMSDSYRGFPAFLQNNFVGNAKTQLTKALVKLKLLTEEEVARALQAKPLPFSKGC